jgi:hypothetical protein
VSMIVLIGDYLGVLFCLYDRVSNNSVLKIFHKNSVCALCELTNCKSLVINQSILKPFIQNVQVY